MSSPLSPRTLTETDVTILGSVFEKRLIEAHISEHGTDPTTNEELSTDDLVELKASRTPRPRPPTLTSIPSLLSVFQNEWDALALETFTLRQQLQQTRYELSTALYQNDAAVKIIASLTRERDEAREALSKIGLNGSATGGGDAMQVDGQGLSRELIEKIDTTQERYLSRKKAQHISTYLVLGFRKQDGNARHLKTGPLRRNYRP